jgi:hypothetical protein
MLPSDSTRTAKTPAEDEKADAPPPQIKEYKGSLLASSVGFGALFFVIHWLFTDSGTTIAWTWSGYPIRGPTAMPHGLHIIAQLSAGTLVSASQSISTAWLMLGAPVIGATLLYSASGWVGMQGANALAFFSTATFPFFVKAAVRHKPGSTFLVAMLVYAVLELASVWTVAYAFVPGGPYLRERTDLVLGAAIFLVCVGFVNARNCARCQPRGTSTTSTDLRLLKVLAVCLLLGVLVVVHRRPSSKPLPYHPDARLITAGIWTVHFGMDGR